MENSSNIFYLKKETDLILYYYNKITAIYSYSLKEHIKDLINGLNIINIWIDLSRCTYMDSTAIGTILQINNMAEKNKGKLFLCNLNEDINEIFSNTNLNNFLNIEKNCSILDWKKNFLR